MHRCVLREPWQNLFVRMKKQTTRLQGMLLALRMLVGSSALSPAHLDTNQGLIYKVVLTP